MKIKKVEDYIENFQTYETQTMNKLIKEMIDLKMLKSKDLKFCNRKTSLKN